MAKYQKYAEYQDSGVEWLGEIPSHWNQTYLKYVVLINMGQSPSSEDCNIDGIGIPFLQGNAEFGTYSPTAKNYCPIPKKIADKGDLLFSVRAPVGALNYADMQYGIGRGLCSLKSRSSINSSFLWWVLPTYKYQLDAIATGSTFEAVSAEEVANLKFPLPTIVEQQKIANFLDHETTQIDTLIAKQEKLIELLKEKRQAVISHAVTKGLNPNVSMKDSGVEWLGDTGSLFFRIANLTRDTIEPKLESLQFVEPPQGSEGERSKIKVGDLLISITADLGSVCVADTSIGNGYVSQHIALCRPQKLYDSRWLAYYILSDTAKEQLLGSGYGGTKIQLSLEDIKELVVVVPSQEEQREIANYINDKLNQFEHLINQAYKFVGTLRERRITLISSAVTGKIDVRNWQHPNEAKTGLSS